MQRIYLDNNATTAIDPVVARQLASCYQSWYMNPASQHSDGRRAKQVIEDARDDVCRSLGASLEHGEADTLVFTSGATEGNNAAILGLAGSSGHVMLSRIEHPSVVEPARILQSRGLEIDWIPVTPNGVIDLTFVADRIRDDTRLVAVMLGNHETGVIQPVRQVVDICQDKGVPVHCDAAQAAGKITVHFRGLGVTSLSVAAHKFHGPRGIGALLVRHGTAMAPLLTGGPQQRGIRPGTEPVCLALAMATALSRQCPQEGGNILRQVRDLFERLVVEQVASAIIVGAEVTRLPQTSCIAFPPLDRQAAVMALDLAGIACSTGSACASGSSDPSPVLLEMGLEERLVQSAVRFSFSTTDGTPHATQAAQRISSVINSLRREKQA
ncbi:MAG: cysteine desulfurase family protein [Pirellulaceae bacterium]|jgi:cysteine desulfurase|nr:cysteine desulfurase family protein [Pirellulaceae bacterium]